MNNILYSIAALFLTIFLIKLFSSPATKLGLIDHPGGRKKHQTPVPLIGGITIFCSFCFIVLFNNEATREYSSLFFGMATLLIVGFLDDLHDISAKARLLMQVMTAIMMATWGGQTITSLGNFFGTGEVLLNLSSIPFTVICTVGLINAVNMIDGLDGLAGGLIIVALSWLTYAGIAIGSSESTTLILILISTISGFMVFNFRHPWRNRASIFLGDAGSMMLGFALAWFTIDLSNDARGSIPPISLAWILALPIIDALSLITRRISKGKHPFEADREHLHHILLRAGFSSRTTVNIIIATSFIMGGVGTLGWQYGVPEYYLLYGLLIALIMHLYIIKHAWRIMKVLKKLNR